MGKIMGKAKWMAVICVMAVFVCLGVVDVKAEGTEIDTSVFEYEENEDGTITITDYTGTDETVVIPSEIDGKTVTGIGDYAFNGCSSLTSATIPSGVTSIGEYAFGYCSSLTSITIPSGVTSIGDYAFHYCSSLTSATIPSGVTSVGEGVFFECGSLTSITISSGVTSIGDYAFGYCSSLTYVMLPTGIMSIGRHTFEECSSLISITIPSGVTSIEEGAFYHCSSLASIELPIGITSIEDNTFYDCRSLKSVTISSGVTSIGDSAFDRCISLNSVEIPSGVTSIGKWAFFGCVSLEKLIVPDSVVQIGEEAFYIGFDDRIPIYGNPDAYIKTYCDADRKIKFSCINHPNIVIDPAVAPNCKYGGRTEGSHCSVCGTAIVEQQYIRPNGQHSWDDGVILLNPTAKRDGEKRYTCTVCHEYKHETIPAITAPKKGDSITNSNVIYKVTNTSRAGSTVEFTATQESGTDITIPSTFKIDGINYKVTSIAKNAFKNNKNLKKVTINGNITKIDANAFRGCTNLKTIIIKSKKLKSVGKNAFKGISPKARIKVPSGKLEQYKKLLAKKGQKPSVKIIK